MPRAWLSKLRIMPRSRASERKPGRQPPKKEWLREAGGRKKWLWLVGCACNRSNERTAACLHSSTSRPGRAWGLDGVLERREADASDAHTHEGSRRSSCFAWFHDSSLYDASEELPWSSSSSSDAAARASRLRLLLVLTPTGASGSYCGFGHPSINTGAQKNSVGNFFDLNRPFAVNSGHFVGRSSEETPFRIA